MKNIIIIFALICCQLFCVQQVLGQKSSSKTKGGCPNIWNLTFPILNQNIVDFEAKYYIFASNVIENGAIADYDAGEEITLKDNFWAEEGCEFHAFIDGCGNLKVGGEVELSDPLSPLDAMPTSVDLKSYPNPFADRLTVAFSLDETSRVELVVVDLFGKQVRNLITEQEMFSGRHEAHFYGGQLPAGMYICKLRVNGKNYSSKVVLAR